MIALSFMALGVCDTAKASALCKCFTHSYFNQANLDSGQDQHQSLKPFASHDYLDLNTPIVYEFSGQYSVIIDPCGSIAYKAPYLLFKTGNDPPRSFAI